MTIEEYAGKQMGFSMPAYKMVFDQTLNQEESRERHSYIISPRKPIIITKTPKEIAWSQFADLVKQAKGIP
jgi:hypothetical protein